MTEKCLKIFGVEVRFRSGGASNGYKVRVKLGETLKRIKRHITESLDIQGRLAYKEFNFDDHPTKRLSEVYKEGDETFCLATEKKPRDLKHQVQLKLPNSMTGVVKIARTTTIANLKHKIQDEYGILVDEQAIYVPSQQKECQQDTNVMLLSSPLLEVRLVRKEAMQKKPPQALKFRTPYDTKQSACVSKRKIYDSSPIHPKTFKGKEKSGKVCNSINIVLLIALQCKRRKCKLRQR